MWAALITALLLVNTSSTTRAGKSNWPQFRGPNCSGHAEGQNPPIEFGPERNLLWETPVPSGHSSPCIWGDRIFLTGFDKDKKQLRVFCLERSSGKIRWSRSMPIEQFEKLKGICSPAQATPAADGERIYVYFGSCGLLCYDFTGKLLWKVPLPIPSTQENGAANSPILTGKLVILNRDDSKAPSLLALDPYSGETVWKHTQSSTGASYSTPVVWADQLILHRRREIVAHAVADGTRIWSVSVRSLGESTPVIGNNVLFVGAWMGGGEPTPGVNVPDFKALIKQYDKNNDMKISRSEFPRDLQFINRPEAGDPEEAKSPLRWFLREIDRNKDSLIDETEWEAFKTSGPQVQKKNEHGLVAIKSGGKGDVTVTHVLWKEKRYIPEAPSPLYHDGRVYMIKNGGIISCMDAETGKLLYRERLGAAGLYCSSPICADGRIYIASGNGVMTVFKAGDTLQVLARNKLGEKVFATPAVVDDKLYVRTVENMYAFGRQ
jgi:outer membrane protein assembly factor BamB